MSRRSADGVKKSEKLRLLETQIKCFFASRISYWKIGDEPKGPIEFDIKELTQDRFYFREVDPYGRAESFVMFHYADTNYSTFRQEQVFNTRSGQEFKPVKVPYEHTIPKDGRFHDGRIYNIYRIDEDGISMLRELIKYSSADIKVYEQLIDKYKKVIDKYKTIDHQGRAVLKFEVAGAGFDAEALKVLKYDAPLVRELSLKPKNYLPVSSVAMLKTALKEIEEALDGILKPFLKFYLDERKSFVEESLLLVKNIAQFQGQDVGLLINEIESFIPSRPQASFTYKDNEYREIRIVNNCLVYKFYKSDQSNALFIEVEGSSDKGVQTLIINGEKTFAVPVEGEKIFSIMIDYDKKFSQPFELKDGQISLTEYPLPYLSVPDLSSQKYAINDQSIPEIIHQLYIIGYIEKYIKEAQLEQEMEFKNAIEKIDIDDLNYILSLYIFTNDKIDEMLKIAEEKLKSLQQSMQQEASDAFDFPDKIRRMEAIIERLQEYKDLNFVKTANLVHVEEQPRKRPLEEGGDAEKGGQVRKKQRVTNTQPQPQPKDKDKELRIEVLQQYTANPEEQTRKRLLEKGNAIEQVRKKQRITNTQYKQLGIEHFELMIKGAKKDEMKALLDSSNLTHGQINELSKTAHARFKELQNYNSKSSINNRKNILSIITMLKKKLSQMDEPTQQIASVDLQEHNASQLPITMLQLGRPAFNPTGYTEPHDSGYGPANPRYEAVNLATTGKERNYAAQQEERLYMNVDDDDDDDEVPLQDQLMAETIKASREKHISDEARRRREGRQQGDDAQPAHPTGQMPGRSPASSYTGAASFITNTPNTTQGRDS